MKILSLLAALFMTIAVCGCSEEENRPLSDDMVNKARFEVSGTGLGTEVFDNSDDLFFMYFPTDQCTLLFGVGFKSNDNIVSTGTYMFDIEKLGQPINKVYLDGGTYRTNVSEPNDEVRYTNLQYNGHYYNENVPEERFRSMTVTKCDRHELGFMKTYYHVVGTFEYDAFEMPTNNKMDEFHSNLVELIWIHGMTGLQAQKALGMKEIKCRGSFDVWIPAF